MLTMHGGSINSDRNRHKPCTQQWFQTNTSPLAGRFLHTNPAFRYSITRFTHINPRPRAPPSLARAGPGRPDPSPGCPAELETALASAGQELHAGPARLGVAVGGDVTLGPDQVQHPHVVEAAAVAAAGALERPVAPDHHLRHTLGRRLATAGACRAAMRLLGGGTRRLESVAATAGACLLSQPPPHSASCRSKTNAADPRDPADGANGKRPSISGREELRACRAAESPQRR